MGASSVGDKGLERLPPSTPQRVITNSIRSAMSTSPTTIKQTQGRLPFDEKLFEQAALTADEGAGYVAINLGKVIYSDKLEQILEYLLSKSSLFEYIYSSGFN